MAKKKKPSSLPVGGPFVPILIEQHDSRAYNELTGNAAKLHGYLVRAARTVALKLGADSEYQVDFDYTYAEAKKRGFSESTFKRAIRELWAKGFLSVVAIGGRTASACKGKMSSKYKLCGLWKTYGNMWTVRTKSEPDPWASCTEPQKGDKGRW